MFDLFKGIAIVMVILSLMSLTSCGSIKCRTGKRLQNRQALIECTKDFMEYNESAAEASKACLVIFNNGKTKPTIKE